MPGPDRHRRGPLRVLRAARSRHRRTVDPLLRRGAYRRAHVFGADDRERAQPSAHWSAPGGVHGFLRSPEPGCHFRTCEKLTAMSKIEIGKKAPSFTLD